ncbi:trehalase-like isoform X2 [Rhynchophorus ferrugineus]|uniref:trehalase-like isoform X2 n=2 Tax=Rhynchophorus ferrugineus TaxID=354439 RepID=UPI003FCEA08E
MKVRAIMKIHLFVFAIAVFIYSTEAMKSLRRKRRQATVESCPSFVYCQGQLLDTVQHLRIYKDSKTFVDMSQRNTEETTLANFNTMMKNTNNKPTVENVTKFINQNFLSETEMDDWTPSDFKTNPDFLSEIRDRKVKRFATQLVAFWPHLGRKIKNSVKNNPSRYSLIPVPQGFIVPGGRFREIYYWDSYWIIKGLLLSEMHDTTRGMLDNFIYMIKTYGFIPNGSRVYYLNRSQPPLFTLMVDLYISSSNDIDWLKDNIQYIEKELLFWLNQRTVTITKDGVQHKLAHFGPESNTPRPESYAEDIITCAGYTTAAQKAHCYNALKTGAETGWDFSTRWLFDNNGGTNTNLTKIDAQRVIPVDLNAFLCKSFKSLSDFYEKIGNSTKQAEWSTRHQSLLNSTEALLYDKEDGIWYDYDRTLNKQRKIFFASNFAPLWSNCYNTSQKDSYGERAAKYMYAKGVHTYLGGIPTSLEQSGEQWDLPNAWPPLQEFVILGLHNTENSEAKKIAAIFAKRWIAANMVGFERDGAMYEKYDAIHSGSYGGGGEYDVQIGFGWSNGVALSLIDTFYASGASMSTVSLNWFKYFGLSTLLIYFHRSVR